MCFSRVDPLIWPSIQLHTLSCRIQVNSQKVALAGVPSSSVISNHHDDLSCLLFSVALGDFIGSPSMLPTGGSKDDHDKR